MTVDTSLQAVRCRKCDKRTFYTIPARQDMIQAAKNMLKVRCGHCGAGVRSLTMGEGRTNEEDRPTRQLWASEEVRAANWLHQGEKGSSALSIHAFMTGVEEYRKHQAPSDLDDMRRCVLLMQHVPEWLDRIQSMRTLEQWANIAPVFHVIQAAYLEESPNLDGPAPKAARILEMHRQ